MPLHTTHIKLTPTATGSAPAGSEGTVYYDSSVDALRQYGTSYRSTFPVYSIELLMVAGGGGGNLGAYAGGGGGAGGVLNKTISVIPGTVYVVGVGAGGHQGCNGQSSTFGEHIAYGGGAGSQAKFAVGEPSSGGEAGGAAAGRPGGSGGGASEGGSGSPGGGGAYPSSALGIQTSPRQGYNGGSTVGSGNNCGAGGGGAGAAGVNAPLNDSGEGGDGVNTYDTWLQAVESSQALGEEISSVRWIAGGGAGGGHYGAANSAAGGKGGGGNGPSSHNASNGTAGTALSGGGGGAGTSYSGWAGKAGGSGFVMFRYAGGSALNSAGNITPVVSGGYVYHLFTSTGTYTA